jgi:uncharacterized protein (DUF2062 family)
MARKLFKRYLPSTDAILSNRFLRMLGPRLRHPNLWHLNKRSCAGGVAVGLATGLIPGPLQMLSAAILAVLLRVNLPISLVTTLYTNPFTIVPLYLLAYTLGSIFTGASISELVVPKFEWYWDELSNSMRQFMHWVLSLGHTLIIGLIMEGILFAGAGYLLVRLFWRMHVVHAWRKRQTRRA